MFTSSFLPPGISILPFVFSTVNSFISFFQFWYSIWQRNYAWTTHRIVHAAHRKRHMRTTNALARPPSSVVSSCHSSLTRSSRSATRFHWELNNSNKPQSAQLDRVHFGKISLFVVIFCFARSCWISNSVECRQSLTQEVGIQRLSSESARFSYVGINNTSKNMSFQGSGPISVASNKSNNH